MYRRLTEQIRVITRGVVLCIVLNACTHPNPQVSPAPWKDQIATAYSAAIVIDPTAYLHYVTALSAPTRHTNASLQVHFFFTTPTGAPIDVTLSDIDPIQTVSVLPVSGNELERDATTIARYRQAIHYVRLSPAEALAIGSSSAVQAVYDLRKRTPIISLLLADEVRSELGIVAVWLVSWESAAGDQIEIWIDAQQGTIVDMRLRTR